MKAKLVRLTTVAISMDILLKGQLKFMNEYFEVVGITSFDKKHYQRVESREGIRMIPVEMKRSIDMLNDVMSLWRLIRIFYVEKPDIVHTHSPKAGLLGMFAALLTGVPIRMHTIAGMPVLEISGVRWYIVWLAEYITCLCATNVYPNSFGLVKLIRQLKLCPSRKLEVLVNGTSNGIDAAYFSKASFKDHLELRTKMRLELGIEDDELCFCFIGRIAEDKGIRELVEAFTRLNDEHPKTKLLLIGPFEKEYSILPEEIVENITNHACIIYLGRKDDVRPFYLVSDVLVFPSYREGFPNVVLQAGAMGLPVIATDICGCNEAIVDGMNGILVPAKNWGALLSAMKELTVNRALLRDFASNARQMIENRYDQNRIWSALKREYEDNLKNVK